MYILLIQPPPALQPSPCPVLPLVFKAAGRDAGSSSSIASTLLPNSVPLIARAGVEMLVLIIVGNTNQRGTFHCSCLHLCFLSASFQQTFSLSHLSEFPGGWWCLPQLQDRDHTPGAGAGGRIWVWWGRGCLGVSSSSPIAPWLALPMMHMMGAPGSLTQGQPPASPLPKAPSPGHQHLCEGVPSPPCLPTHPGTVPSPPAGATRGTGCTVCILYHFNEGAHCPV